MKISVPLRAVAVIVLATTIASMSACMDMPHTTTPDVTTDIPTAQLEYDDMGFTSDISSYEKYMNPDSYPILLVNKTNLIDESYNPGTLMRVRDAHKNIDLCETPAMALEAMFNEMRALGYTNVFVTSAYRSYTYQVYLFNMYIDNEMAKNKSLTTEQATALVLKYSARPGTSEHQTGLCVDLMTNQMTDLDESFANDKVYAWLTENAWKFGFILRYPKDKTEITEYDFEPWHYRFVGRKAAYEIHRDGLCLEEYLNKQ